MSRVQTRAIREHSNHMTEWVEGANGNAVAYSAAITQQMERDRPEAVITAVSMSFELVAASYAAQRFAPKLEITVAQASEGFTLFGEKLRAIAQSDKALQLTQRTITLIENNRDLFATINAALDDDLKLVQPKTTWSEKKAAEIAAD